MDYDYSSYSSYISEPTVTTTVDKSLATDVFGLMLASMGLVIFFSLLSYAISSFLLSRIFKKAGIEAWKAWVPFLNIWMFLEIGKQKGWYLLLNFIPVVGSLIFFVFYIMAAYNIGKSLGKDGVFVLLAVFLMPIWYIWLAFDKSTWEGQAATATYAQPVMAPATPSYNAPQQNVAPVAPVQTPAAPAVEEKPTDPSQNI
jgi:hypothetical protein